MTNTITTGEARSNIIAFRPASKARKTPNQPKPIAQRLAAMVDTTGGLFACHPFTGSTMQGNGYGQISGKSPTSGKKTMRSVHVVAWEVANSQTVPAGKIVLHNRGCCKTCCNPAHLRLGTHAENNADAVAEGHVGKRLTKATVLEIVMLHQKHGVTAAALAHRFQLDPSTTRRIIRGESHAKLTGIERHRGKPGRKPSVLPAVKVVINRHLHAEAGMLAMIGARA